MLCIQYIHIPISSHSTSVINVYENGYGVQQFVTYISISNNKNRKNYKVSLHCLLIFILKQCILFQRKNGCNTCLSLCPYIALTHFQVH